MTARLELGLLQQQCGRQLRAVPYKGSGTSMTELIVGQVLVGIDTASAARPFVSSGRLKALAVTSRGDSALLLGARSVAASGLQDFEMRCWPGMPCTRSTVRRRPWCSASTPRCSRSSRSPRCSAVCWSWATRPQAAVPSSSARLLR